MSAVTGSSALLSRHIILPALITGQYRPSWGKKKIEEGNDIAGEGCSDQPLNTTNIAKRGENRWKQCKAKAASRILLKTLNWGADVAGEGLEDGSSRPRGWVTFFFFLHSDRICRMSHEGKGVGSVLARKSDLGQSCLLCTNQDAHAFTYTFFSR